MFNSKQKPSKIGFFMKRKYQQVFSHFKNLTKHLFKIVQSTISRISLTYFKYFTFVLFPITSSIKLRKTEAQGPNLAVYVRFA